jgi:aspartate 1-decarboxylase
MSNGRIYNQKIFLKEVKNLKIKIVILNRKNKIINILKETLKNNK